MQAVEGAEGSSSAFADAARDGKRAYFPEAGSVASAGAFEWGFVPRGAQSLLLQPLQGAEGSREGSGERGNNGTGGSKGMLILWSDRPRALSQRERNWAAAVGAKARAVLEKSV